MKVPRKFLIRVLSWLVVILIAVLFARALLINWHNMGELQLRPNGYVVLALMCFVVSIVVSGLVWGRVIVRLTGERIGAGEAVRIHLASWLLKYIPGQAGSFLNKLSWAKTRGLDGKKVAASFVYENAFLLLASTITAVPILMVALSSRFVADIGLFVPLLIAVPVAVLVVVTPRFFSVLLNVLFRLLKKKKLSSNELLSVRENLGFLLEFMLPRLFNGAAFVLLAVSLVGIAPGQYLTFGAIYVPAGIVGVLAIFVPSGLGVREAVVTLFASAYIPLEQAIALALVARFYATLADVFIAILYLYLNSKKD